LNIYNHAAGGPFPPGLPEKFSEWKFGHADVVILEVADSAKNHHGSSIAGHLQTSREFRGLVYSYYPENRDFLRCADFFRVSAFPSYVVISYRAFRELLCTSKVSPPYDNEKYIYEDRTATFYHSDHLRQGGKLEYGVINADVLAARDRSIDVAQEVLKIARDFCTKGIRKSDEIAFSFGSISRFDLDAIKHSAQPSAHGTEIIVLFTRPAWRHTDFERVLYDSFISFGAITDDVLVRILYPTYISNAYSQAVAEYNIIKLPAAVFTSGDTGRFVMKVERDFFECLSDSGSEIDYVISDIHRAIASGNKNTAKGIVKKLRSSALKESVNGTGKHIIQVISEKAVIVDKMFGNINT
jgi:hypothetical protein